MSRNPQVLQLLPWRCSLGVIKHQHAAVFHLFVTRENQHVTNLNPALKLGAVAVETDPLLISICSSFRNQV